MQTPPPLLLPPFHTIVHYHYPSSTVIHVFHVFHSLPPSSILFHPLPPSSIFFHPHSPFSLLLSPLSPIIHLLLFSTVLHYSSLSPTLLCSPPRSSIHLYLPYSFHFSSSHSHPPSSHFHILPLLPLSVHPHALH